MIEVCCLLQVGVTCVLWARPDLILDFQQRTPNDVVKDTN